MSSAMYDTPAAWAAGPDLIYGALAEAALKLLPLPAPPRVLDAGTGTGAFARVLGAGGGASELIAVDTSAAMLRHDRSVRPPALVGDVQALPLRDGVFDAVVAGFVLSHLADPLLGLIELTRVTRPGGVVLATAFPSDPSMPTHSTKAAVDEVLARFGYESPDWYAAFKSAGELRTGAVADLEVLAASAGLDSVQVAEIGVDLGGFNSDARMRWRFGMAHIAPWLQAQTRVRQSELEQAAREALDLHPSEQLPMLVLRAVRP